MAENFLWNFFQFESEINENSGDDADYFPKNTSYKELIPQFYSNIQRALALVKLNKVKFNAEDKFWVVMDENDPLAPKITTFVVKLFPNPICSYKYVWKLKCSHLLSVMHSNGMSITDVQKLPKLSELTRLKRNVQKRVVRNAAIREMESLQIDLLQQLRIS